MLLSPPSPFPQGVVPLAPDGDGFAPLCGGGELPAAFQELLATCHGLAQLGAELVGDPLDQRLFQSTGGWRGGAGRGSGGRGQRVGGQGAEEWVEGERAGGVGLSAKCVSSAGLVKRLRGGCGSMQRQACARFQEQLQRACITCRLAAPHAPLQAGAC